MIFRVEKRNGRDDSVIDVSVVKCGPDVLIEVRNPGGIAQAMGRLIAHTGRLQLAHSINEVKGLDLTSDGRIVTESE